MSDPLKIEYHLKSLPYLFRVSAIRENLFSKDVVGWNVSSSSSIRKEYSIYRIKKEIEENNLPLRIEERDDEFSLTRFQVYLT